MTVPQPTRPRFFDTEVGVWTVLLGASFTVLPELGAGVLFALLLRLGFLTCRTFLKVLSGAGRSFASALWQLFSVRGPRKQDPAPLPRRPLPPRTPDERGAIALEQYEAKLKMLAKSKLDELEMKAAQDRAKQQYLRELDRVME